MRYSFCSNCGTVLPPSESFQPQHCDHCGAWHYHNSKPCAGALVVSEGQVLLAQRGVEPFKGYWDIPGGFLEAGESPEAGAIRELLEETGLEIRLLGLLDMYIDLYGAAGYYTLNIYYLAEIVRGTPQATDDVAALEWFDMDKLPREFAFAHQHKLMQVLRDRLAPTGQGVA